MPQKFDQRRYDKTRIKVFQIPPLQVERTQSSMKDIEGSKFMTSRGRKPKKYKLEFDDLPKRSIKKA